MALIRAAARYLTQDFGENENQNHADEETRLLGSATDASIADDADGKASSQTGETDGETGAELDEPLVERHDLLEAIGDKDGDDEAVDADDTSHDDGHDVYVALDMLSQAQVCRQAQSLTLDDKVWSQNTHGRDADTRLGRAVGRAEASEDNGDGAAHSAEERLSIELATAQYVFAPPSIGTHRVRWHQGQCQEETMAGGERTA